MFSRQKLSWGTCEQQGSPAPHACRAGAGRARAGAPSVPRGQAALGIIPRGDAVSWPPAYLPGPQLTPTPRCHFSCELLAKDSPRPQKRPRETFWFSAASPRRPLIMQKTASPSRVLCRRTDEAGWLPETPGRFHTETKQTAWLVHEPHGPITQFQQPSAHRSSCFRSVLPVLRSG